MIRLCAICGKPIYSWDKAWSNDYGQAAHSACFGALMYRFNMGLIPIERFSLKKPRAFDRAFYFLMTMEGEKPNEWCWQRNCELGLQPRQRQKHPAGWFAEEPEG